MGKIKFRKVEKKDLNKIFNLLQQLTEIDYSDRDLDSCWDKFTENGSSSSIVGLCDDDIIAYGSIVIENKKFEENVHILHDENTVQIFFLR